MEYEVNIGFLKEANFNSYFMADSSGERRRRGLDIVQKVPPVQRSAHSAGEQV